MLRWAQGRCLLLAGQVSDEELLLLVRGASYDGIGSITIPLPIQANWEIEWLLPHSDHLIVIRPWQTTVPLFPKVVPVLVATDIRRLAWGTGRFHFVVYN